MRVLNEKKMDNISSDKRRINGSIKERYLCCPTGEIMTAYNIIAEANNIDITENFFVVAYFIKGLSMARAPSSKASIFKNKETIQIGFSLILVITCLKFLLSKFLTASMSDPFPFSSGKPKSCLMVSIVVSCQNNLGM